MKEFLQAIEAATYFFKIGEYKAAIREKQTALGLFHTKKDLQPAMKEAALGLSWIRMPQTSSYRCTRKYGNVAVGGQVCLLILAGTLEEAHQYVEERRPKRWAYIRGPRTFYDYSPLSRVVLIGTWNERPDKNRLLEAVKDLNLTVTINRGVSLSDDAQDPISGTRTQKRFHVS